VAQVQADLAILETMPTSTEPVPFPTYGDDVEVRCKRTQTASKQMGCAKIQEEESGAALSLLTTTSPLLRRVCDGLTDSQGKRLAEEERSLAAAAAFPTAGSAIARRGGSWTPIEDPETTICTRRFWARPELVELSAMGLLLP